MNPKSSGGFHSEGFGIGIVFERKHVVFYFFFFVYNDNNVVRCGRSKSKLRSGPGTGRTPENLKTLDGPVPGTAF